MTPLTTLMDSLGTAAMQPPPSLPTGVLDKCLAFGSALAHSGLDNRGAVTHTAHSPYDVD